MAAGPILFPNVQNRRPQNKGKTLSSLIRYSVRLRLIFHFFFFQALPKAKYGGRHTVTMLPGLGIGPELMSYVKQVFVAAGVPVDFEEFSDSSSYEDFASALTSIKRNGVGIKGMSRFLNVRSLTSLYFPGNIESKGNSQELISPNVALRNELDLFVNVIHCASYPGVPSRHKDIDIYLIRQNVEGEYANLEHEVR